MAIRFLPQTKLGKWAVSFAALWPILTILGSVIANALYPAVEAGDGIIDDLRVRPILAVSMLLGIALGAVSFPMSLLAIFKKRERSMFSILAAIVGLLLVILLAGELFIGH